MMITKEVNNEEFIPEVGKLIEAGHTVTMQVKGNSMRPMIESMRDKVVLSPCTQVSVGDVILAQIAPEKYVLHRVVSKIGCKLILMGDGNVKGKESCELSDVVAKAVAFIRKHNRSMIHTNSLRWRMYSFLWVHLCFMRRYLLAFYRLIWMRIFYVTNH